jgi:AsmA protein
VGSIPITRSNRQPGQHVKKLLKITAITLGAIIALLIVAVIALPLLIDANQFKPQIAEAVKKQTGRELTMEGEIGLSVFPSIALDLGKTRLSNAPGFGKLPFAQIDSVAVSVRLWPLLHKQIVIDKVKLDGLQLNLARDRHGRNNWDDMIEASQRAKGAKGQVPAGGTSPAAAAGAIGSFRIDDGIDIRNCTFRWDDAKAGAPLVIDRLALRTGAIAPAQPVNVNLGFDLRSGKPVLRTRVDLKGQVTVDPEKQTLRAREVELRLGPLTVRAKVDAAHLLTTPSVNGEVSVADFNLAELLKTLGVHYATADAKALTHASASATVDGTPSHIYLRKLKLKLDDTTVTGSASARFASLPAIDFDLAADGVDLDRYLSPAKAKAGTKAKTAPAAGIPIALLKKLDARGHAQIGKLTAFGIRSTNISIRMTAKNGLARLGPNSAQLYGGRYAGNTTIDVRQGAPRFNLDEKLSGVEVGGLLKDTGIFDRFSGTGNVQAKLTARGIDTDDFLRSLNGTASGSLRNGSLRGVDVYDTVIKSCEAGRYIKTKAAEDSFTPFASLGASATIRNGVVDNRDLKLSGKLFEATGAGTVDLGRGTINYLAEVRLLEKTKCPLSIFHIPLKGKLAGMNGQKIIGDAVAYELQEQAKRAVQKKIDKEKKKIQRDLQEELRKRLGLPPK